MQQICFATSDGRVVIACTNISSFIAEDFVPQFRRSSHKKQAVAIESLLSLRRQTFKSFFTVAVILSKICISGLFSQNVLHRIKTGSIKRCFYASFRFTYFPLLILASAGFSASFGIPHVLPIVIVPGIRFSLHNT